MIDYRAEKLLPIDAVVMIQVELVEKKSALLLSDEYTVFLQKEPQIFGGKEAPSPAVKIVEYFCGAESLVADQILATHFDGLLKVCHFVQDNADCFVELALAIF